MSSQRGNAIMTRTQKHNNKVAFKNDLHNKSQKVAIINKTPLWGVCSRCRDKIQWKIKYGKYKPLTVPRKCVRCDAKTVKQAYYLICFPCGSKHNICCKCGDKKVIVEEVGLTAEEEDHEKAMLKENIKYLRERERRTFLRRHEKTQLKKGEDLEDDDSSDSEDDEDAEDAENGECSQTRDTPKTKDDLDAEDAKNGECSQTRDTPKTKDDMNVRFDEDLSTQT